MGLGASVPAGGPIGGFFEGTEKRIEIDFRGEAGDGLRSLDGSVWEEVIRLCNTQALNSKTTSCFTSYLLSESSLLVYPQKVIVKTCGRTQPLASIGKIFEVARSINLEPEWFLYSRKSFMAPQHQPDEHQSMDREAQICKRECAGHGNAYVLGPLTGDHWLIYDAELLDTDCSTRGDLTVDMMMYDLPEEVRNKFYTDEPEGSRKGAEAMTTNSGIADVAASLEEEQCSYASWETNLGFQPERLKHSIGPQIGDMVARVLRIFRPGKFTMTIFIDDGAQAALSAAPFDAVPSEYKQLTWTSQHFPNEYRATVANYQKVSA